MGYTLEGCTACCEAATGCQACDTGYYMCITTDCSGLNDAQITLLPESDAPTNNNWSNEADPFTLSCSGCDVTGFFTLHQNTPNCDFTLVLNLNNDGGNMSVISPAADVEISGESENGTALTGIFDFDWDTWTVGGSGAACSCMFEMLRDCIIDYSMQCDPCSICPSGDIVDPDDPCCPCCDEATTITEMDVDFGAGGLTDGNCNACDEVVGVISASVLLDDEENHTCSWRFDSFGGGPCVACIRGVEALVARRQVLVELIGNGEDCFWRVTVQLGFLELQGCDNPLSDEIGFAIYESTPQNSFGFNCLELPITLPKIQEVWTTVCNGSLPSTISLDKED